MKIHFRTITNIRTDIKVVNADVVNVNIIITSEEGELFT